MNSIIIQDSKGNDMDDGETREVKKCPRCNIVYDSEYYRCIECGHKLESSLIYVDN